MELGRWAIVVHGLDRGLALGMQLLLAATGRMSLLAMMRCSLVRNMLALGLVRDVGGSFECRARSVESWLVGTLLRGTFLGGISAEVEFGRVHGIRLVRVGLLEEGGVEIVMTR